MKKYLNFNSLVFDRSGISHNFKYNFNTYYHNTKAYGHNFNTYITLCIWRRYSISASTTTFLNNQINKQFSSSIVLKDVNNIVKNNLSNIKYYSSDTNTNNSELNDSIQSKLNNNLEKGNFLDQVKSNELNIINNNFANKFYDNIGIFYKEIYKIISDNKLAISEKQLMIEETYYNNLKNIIKNILIDKVKLISNAPGIDQLNQLINNLSRDIDDLKSSDKYLAKKSFKNIFKEMSNSTVIIVLFSNIISHCIKFGGDNNQNITNLLIKIGKELIHFHIKDMYFKEFNNSSSVMDITEFKEKYIKSSPDLIDYYNIDDEKINIFYLDLGSSLVEYCAIFTDLYKMQTVKIKDNMSNRIIVPGKELNDKIANYFGFSISNLPMICKPLNWEVEINHNYNEYNKDTRFTPNYTIVKYGGYLTNPENKRQFISHNNKNKGVNKLVNDNIIQTINYLSSVELCINIPLLKIIFKLLDDNVTQINDLIYTSLHPDTTNLYNLSLSHIKNKNKMIKIYKHNSKYYQDSSILKTALIFSHLTTNNESLFMPYFIDFRGRIYPSTGYLSPQSSELGRSLLVYKNGYILNQKGLENLKKYTANCFGLDKLSINEKLKWVDDNLDLILNLGSNYSKDLNFIFNAAEPFLFLSCILELQGYYKNPKKFISTLPIYLDATCSGLQHLASMIKDETLATYVNLFKNEIDEKPFDLYQIMAERVINKINHLNSNEKLVYNDLIINRKFVKNGIMTIPYGATVIGIADQIKNQFFDEEYIEIDGKMSKMNTLTKNEFNRSPFKVKLNNKQIYKLAELIYSSLYESHPSLTKFVDYLKNMNKLLKKLDLNHIWLSPNGIIVEQRYVKMTKKIIISSILGSKRSITMQKGDITSIDLHKQNSSIVPNIIHTLDASNIGLVVIDTINLIKNVNPNTNLKIITIHDCFGSHANHSELLIKQVKSAFIKLYANNNFIDEYHKFILNYILKAGFSIDKKNNIVKLDNKEFEIPSLPQFNNNFELKNNLLGSNYFIK